MPTGVEILLWSGAFYPAPAGFLPAGDEIRALTGPYSHRRGREADPAGSA